MKKEISLIQHMCADLRGYHLLVLGTYFNLTEIPQNCLHTFGLSEEAPTEDTDMWVQSYYDSLPFRDGSLDGAIIPYCKISTELLQELYRSLIGEGKIYIFGNLLSLFYTKKLLTQVDFTILNTRFFHYGSKYFIEAQKHMQVITPVRPQWKLPSFEKIWAKPAARKAHSCKS